jgi:hypothetical protein
MRPDPIPDELWRVRDDLAREGTTSAGSLRSWGLSSSSIRGRCAVRQKTYGHAVEEERRKRAALFLNERPAPFRPTLVDPKPS